MAIEAAVWRQCQRAMENLLKYAERDRFADLRDAIGAAHLAAAYAAVGEEGGLDDLVALVDDDLIATIAGDAVIDFAVRADPRGRTPIDRYLDERGARETPAGREFLRGLRASRVGAFEVLTAAPDGGMELRDLLSDGPTIAVEGDPDLEPSAPGDLIGARLVPFRGGLCFAGGVWALEADSVEALQAAWSGEGAEDFADDPDLPDTTADELRASARENLAALISNLVVEQEIGSLAGELGDEAYEPTRVSWDIPPAQEREAIRRLDAHPALARWPEIGDDSPPIWTWLASDEAELDEEDEADEDDDDRLVGTVEVSDGKVELFANSAARAAAGRALLEAALEGLLRNGAAEPFTMEQALARDDDDPKAS